MSLKLKNKEMEMDNNANPTLNQQLKDGILDAEEICHQPIFGKRKSTKQFNLRKKERELVNKLNMTYVEISLLLQCFRQDKFDFDELRDRKALELNLMTKSIKKEVIDIADQADHLANHLEDRRMNILKMEERIYEQDLKINKIQIALVKLLMKQNPNMRVEDIVKSHVKDSMDLTSYLQPQAQKKFSIRKSPFY